MSNATWELNGSPVSSGYVRLPRVGTWVSDLDVDADGAVPRGQKVTVRLDENTFLVGTVFRSGAPFGRAQYRIVGGAGGLAKRLPARPWRVSPVRIPLGDTLEEAGERLSVASDAGALGTFLPHWVRAEGKASWGVVPLVSAAGATWRVVADGSIWVGPETWPATKARGTRQNEQSVDGVRLYAMDRFDLFPGQMFDSIRVDVVEHRMEQSGVRTLVWMNES